MSKRAPETVFGFPVAPVLELGVAVDQLGIASGGRIGGEDSMFHHVTELLPIVAQEREDGKAGNDSRNLATLREQSTDFIPRIEPYVEVLAGFENPRKTFIAEIGKVNKAVLAAATSWRPAFGTSEVAAAVHDVFGNLVETPEKHTGRLPMLAGLVIVRKQRPKPLKLPPAFVLSVVAPEILTMLDAPLPKAQQNPDVIESVRDHQNPLISMAANRFKGRELRALRAAAPVLLPNIRDLLPKRGNEVTERFEMIKECLQPQD